MRCIEKRSLGLRGVEMGGWVALASMRISSTRDVATAHPYLVCGPNVS